MKLHISKRKIIIWSGIGFIIVFLAYFIMEYVDRHPSTEDAYVQANTANIAAQVTGTVADVYVKDHQAVAKNQLLFTMDPLPFQIAVNKAAATLALQHATFVLAEQNAARIIRLVQIGQETKAMGDQTQSQLDSAKAQLAAAEAQLRQATLDLQHTEIRAPNAGIVTQFFLRPGNNVVANTTLFVLVEQHDFWVDANFKETQVAYVKPGQPVKIKLDMFPHHTFYGVVDAVSSASGAIFSLLPPENASGNWVKITQRFPVKISIPHPDASYPLRAGATATVTIDTTT